MSKSDKTQVKSQANANIAKNDAKSAEIDTQNQDVLGTAKSTAASILPGVTAGYADIAATGGYDPAILGAANKTFGDATSAFGEMAKTGGISPEEEVAMRNRAGEAATSAYQTGADTAQRQLSATGGYGMSGAIIGQLARKGSQAAAQATEDTTASIAGLKQKGREAGAQGLIAGGAAQLEAAGAPAKNRLAALGGATNIYGINEAQVNATLDNILENYRTTGQLNAQDLSLLEDLSKQPGVFDKIISTIGTLGGAAGGIMTGAGALKFGK